ncbi:TPA: hypothetical protein EYP44_03260, partial [Candidatus Bathyarchaeota archaeon]|nr:hypothetical protein [Candidatus Bathyarchaeota archaeon]
MSNPIAKIETALLVLVVIAIVLSGSTLAYVAPIVSAIEEVKAGTEELKAKVEGLSAGLSDVRAAVERVEEIVGAPPAPPPPPPPPPPAPVELVVFSLWGGVEEERFLKTL